MKKYYKIRFWFPYEEYEHIFDIDEFMENAFGYTFPRFYFECEIYGRKNECCLDLKEMTLTITPLKDDGETLISDCSQIFDDRFWIIEKVEENGK